MGLAGVMSHVCTETDFNRFFSSLTARMQSSQPGTPTARTWRSTTQETVSLLCPKPRRTGKSSLELFTGTSSVIQASRVSPSVSSVRERAWQHRQQRRQQHLHQHQHQLQPLTIDSMLNSKEVLLGHLRHMATFLQSIPAASSAPSVMIVGEVTMLMLFVAN